MSNKIKFSTLTKLLRFVPLFLVSRIPCERGLKSNELNQYCDNLTSWMLSKSLHNLFFISMNDECKNVIHPEQDTIWIRDACIWVLSKNCFFLHKFQIHAGISERVIFILCNHGTSVIAYNNNQNSEFLVWIEISE